MDSENWFSSISSSTSMIGVYFFWISNQLRIILAARLNFFDFIAPQTSINADKPPYKGYFTGHK
jgi:hypothetical protein